MKTAYPQVQGACSIRLYSNIPFDNTYEHHSFISKSFTYNGTAIYTRTGDSKQTAKERFLDRKDTATTYVYPRYDLTDVFNFDFQNGLVGSVTLELTPAQTNANYLRLTCGTDVYYYFITGIRQVNYDTYTLSLELDALMSYQDEFLDAMSFSATGIPPVAVMTARKHCHRYTNDGLVPHCADFKAGDSMFSGVKPSVINFRQLLHFKNSQLRIIEGVKWLYICHDSLTDNLTPDPSYTFHGKKLPLCMLCVPINCNSITFKDKDNNTLVMSRSDIDSILNNLVGSGKFHGAKISPYPPFDGSHCTITKSGDDYTIACSDTTMVIGNVGIYNAMQWNNDKTKLLVIDVDEHYPATFNHAIIIAEEKAGDYEFDSVTFGFLKNANKPTITSNRYLDPKINFSPFKKYVLSAVYSQGNEFFPELQYSDGVFANTNLTFKSIYTFYIGDMNIFTYIDEVTDVNSNKFYTYYKLNNIGLTANANYLIPSGENALDVFNATQYQSFYQSKVASGITSALSIAGGIGMIGVGSVASGVGAGMVVAGASMVAGGVASIANNVKSYNAKMEDLKNTPDTINTTGGSYTSDTARGDDLPFVIVYDVTKAVKEQANDFFYSYGYEVSRECYFNTELKYNNDVSGNVDIEMFGRTIFNYVQVNEDITNKINADIPLIVKQKLSQIFNKGITLWTFFGLSSLWDSADYPIDPNYNPDRWFMKCVYDNTEYGL